MKAKHALIQDTFTPERRYPSAPAKVYRYFSEPEYRKRWFGSTEDWSQRPHSLDFRVGGQELEQGAYPRCGSMHRRAVGPAGPGAAKDQD
ncbi:MAG TPA: hypothetical protein VGL34_06280 [Steroidobacteraceae bacterium]|jgi:uncharacterized protein YndB with AHSA1/START domain